MSRRRSEQVVFVVRGDQAAVRTILEDFFVGRGWTARVRADGRLEYERGSRRRTILLGALAGRRFFLTAQIEIREGARTTDIRYRWGADVGAALGGTLGRVRAAREHEQTAAALEKQLADAGRLVQVRRT